MKTFFLAIFLLIIVHIAKSQPNSSELTRIYNVTNTTTMNSIINPYEGSLIFVDSENSLFYFDGNNWIRINENWATIGNSNANNNSFVGTIDTDSLLFKTNNHYRMIILPNGNVGINTLIPRGVFEVNSKLENVDLIPTMTSNSSNSCTLSGSTTSLATTTTYKDAFDNNIYTSWFTSSTSTASVDLNPDAWLTVDFGQAIQILGYTIRAALNTNRAPKAYQLQGSQDGNNWVDLETQNVVTPNNWASIPERNHYILSNLGFRYYRLYMSHSYETYLLGQTSFSNYQISEIELLGDVPEFIVSTNRNVGIGLFRPEYNLHVEGNILANAYNTPDYVFEHYFDNDSKSNTNYKFHSLEEIETFIKKNHHLPNVNSRNENEKQGGVILNEAVEQNLEKIEELYLHTIELEKYITTLERKYDNIKNE